MRHIAQVKRGRTRRLHRKIVQFGDRTRVAVHLHLVLGRPDLGRARRQNQVLRRHRVDDIGGRQTIRLQLGGIQVHLDLARLAAVRIGSGRALYRRQLRAQKILRQIEHPLLRKRLTAQPQLHNRRRGRRVRNDQRRGRARRQSTQHGLAHRRHLRHRHGKIDSRPEENLDHRFSVQRLRFLMLDVVDRNRESAFGVAHDPIRHLIRRHAVEVPHHADHGNVDLGKNVDRRAQDGNGRKNDDEQCHHHKRIRTAKR